MIGKFLFLTLQLQTLTVVLRSVFDVVEPPLPAPRPPLADPLPRVVAAALTGAIRGDGTTSFVVIDSLLLTALVLPNSEAADLFVTPRVSNI